MTVRRIYVASSWRCAYQPAVVAALRGEGLELGWAAGQGKDTAILLSQDGFEPELMYRMVDLLATSIDELITWLQRPVIGSGAEIVYDLTGGKAGPVLDPDTPIRLTIESLAGEGWDGENDNTVFCWEPSDHVTVHVPTNTAGRPPATRDCTSPPLPGSWLRLELR